jgi:hypothetical protein
MRSYERGACNDASSQTSNLRTDQAAVDIIRSILTEIAEEGTLTEQQLWRNAGFIVEMLSKEQ